MKIRTLLMLLGVCALSACSHRYGKTAESFPPAHSSNGVTAAIETGRRFYSAELIEVRDSGIVILDQRMFRLLPYTSVASLHVDGIEGMAGFSGRHAPSADTRNRLRLVSRFPQGLSPALLQQLLGANGQTDLAGENP